MRFLDLTDGPPCGETSHSLWRWKRLRPSPNQPGSGALPGGTVEPGRGVKAAWSRIRMPVQRTAVENLFSIGEAQ